MIIPGAVKPGDQSMCPWCLSTNIGKLLEAPTHGRCHNPGCEGDPNTQARMFWWDQRVEAGDHKVPDDYYDDTPQACDGSHHDPNCEHCYETHRGDYGPDACTCTEMRGR